jgi:peptidoglycan/xylan/chitin deacetylase (PgdA/CDA1 family)
MKPFGIMFHHFHGNGHPEVQGSISAADLNDIILYFGADSFLTPHQWLRQTKAGTLNPGSICLTLDDALRCQYDIALPVLESYGLTAFWFVYSAVFDGKIEPLELYRYYRTTQFDSVDDFYASFDEAISRSAFADEVRESVSNERIQTYLAEFDFYSFNDRKFRFVRDQILKPKRYYAIMDAMVEKSALNIEELAPKLWMDESCLINLHTQGHVIGMHSYSHPTDLQSLSPQDQQTEYSKNFRHLHSLLKEPPVAMSHPCNSYNSETLNILKTLGVQMGFRANMSVLDGGIFEIPREDHTNIIKKARIQ